MESRLSKVGAVIVIAAVACAFLVVPFGFVINMLGLFKETRAQGAKRLAEFNAQMIRAKQDVDAPNIESREGAAERRHL